ncbi:hypothetical protein GHK86_18805 [Acidimicrobiaceae bacterium USS-CC1]|uniref:Uncharacterized protein n=1 Tax=Acidiferrimicrobium australe TaxID=2664430 RepID=A0ABW9QZ82_9ACTN|nr:hypothetical protein [Acidiferrimicrobium australe]
MAELRVEGPDLVLALGPLERVGSFRGRDLRVPLSAVRRVRVPISPWIALRGWRSAGIAVPGWVAMGTRRHGEGWDFTLVRRSGPAVVIELNGYRFDELVVSVADAPATGARLAAAAGIAFDPTPDRGPLGPA